MSASRTRPSPIQIQQDQETLAALHQTVVDTQARTEDLRVQTAAQKVTLDKSLADLNTAKDGLKKLEAKTAKALASQKANYAKLDKNKAAAKKAMDKSSPLRRSSRTRSPSSSASRSRRRRLPRRERWRRRGRQARPGARSSRHTTGRSSGR